MSNHRFLHAAATIITFALTGAVPSVACDRLPANKNPKDVPGISFSPRAAAANLIISADKDRNYDLVDTVDGLTFGFGNWPQHEAGAAFADMEAAEHGQVLTALESCLANFFSTPQNEPAWKSLRLTAKILDQQPTPQAIHAALKQTILSSDFMKRYGEHCEVNCEAGEHDFYHEQEAWFPQSMRYALADRKVVQWQVDYWDRTVVANGAKMAASANMPDDEAAMVGFTAYASSSPAWSDPVITAAKLGGKLQFGNYIWDWKVPPPGAPTDEAGLRRWRYVVIWQYYVENTRREQLKRRPTWDFRGRSIAYYNKYLKQYWVLPALDKNANPIWNSERNLNPELLRPLS